MQDDTISLSDIPYPEGFFDSQAPVMLDYVCARHGVAAPDPSKFYRWCEIGCGSGLTATTLAVANPHASFLGIDIDTTAIASARRRAEADGVPNVTFIDADVAEVDAGALGPFDYITLHGVYSWVPEDVRAGIVRFVDGTLAEGGVLYVSYNALPGWAALVPLRAFYRDAVLAGSGPLRDRALAAAKSLRTLREGRAPYFAKMPEAARYLRLMEAAGPEYALHELLAPQWNLYRFKDVLDAMSPLGLRYVGSADPVDDLPDHSIPVRLRDEVESVGKQGDHEALKDFINNRFFRRDVFVRESASAPEPGRRDERERVITTAEPSIEHRVSVGTPLGQSTIAGDRLDTLARVLGNGAVRIGALLSDPRVALANERGDEQDYLEWLALLISGYVVKPALREVPRSRGREGQLRLASAFNQGLLLAGGAKRETIAFASPVTGSALAMSPPDSDLFRAIVTSETQSPMEVLDILNRDLSRHRDPMLHGDLGREAMNARGGSNAIEMDQFEDALDTFHRQWVPKLSALGVITVR